MSSYLKLRTLFHENLEEAERRLQYYEGRTGGGEGGGGGHELNIEYHGYKTFRFFLITKVSKQGTLLLYHVLILERVFEDRKILKG